MRIGHWAIAIGAPFSLSRSVTIGVISGMKRSGVGVNIHESYIQTDTSINPGNSGGPLLNLAGEVIGVNDFILSPSGGSIGISFAISADLAKYVAGELVRKGHVSRPWLGVIFEPLSREAKARLGLDSGVAISQVFRDSPAAKILRRGDVILDADGEAVHTPADLQTRILSSSPGDELTLRFRRGGESRTEKVRLEPSPPDWFRRASGGSRPDMLAAGE
ncbi:Periplasmic serine endoprotease DegP [bioreactor metagenome]|uniref:Periplasmic serine endoprotease DegP n=1 Tax=bioreactor metagenome TaxID=1076179 RepID=A0A645CJR9_9ZZZZ